MRTEYAILIAHSLSLIQCVGAMTYNLTKQWRGTDFLCGDWDFFDQWDPTHGYVDYQNLEDAISQNLVYATEKKFYMYADSSNVVPSSARGRRSVRISSKAAFGDSIIVLDISHMPTGCATWPAFWTLSGIGPWPEGGEIDIIESVNNNAHNTITLHTSASCTVPPDSLRQPQSGMTLTTDCNAADNGNTGCGVSSPSSSSTGAAFNAGCGGFYVMLRSEDAIKVWFWERMDWSTPLAIRYGLNVSQSLVPDQSWGEPDANFPMASGFCDYDQHFDAHIMVFDLTFCGDWAGSVWSTSDCGLLEPTCQDYVANNPISFQQAYWDINDLRVYTPIS